MDLLTASANELLTAPPALWEAALTGDATDRLLTLRRLAGRWHPDHCTDPAATDVFARIQTERRRVTGGATAVFESTMAGDGKRWSMPYVGTYGDELGTTYIGRRTLLEVMPLDLADLADRAVTQTVRWNFASPAMEEQMRPCLPEVATLHRTADAMLVVRPRHPDLLRLADVMVHVGVVPAEHVAWIGSGLWNLACYLEYAGRAHPVIEATTVWIDVARHRVVLLGGWACAGAIGERWAALPSRSLVDVTPAWQRDPVQRSALGHIQIRRLLRELLGDVTAMGRAPAHAPEPLITFARNPAAGTAVEQYRSWQQALQATFGKPRFVAWDLPTHLIYPEN
jgi:hypothetical protein